MRSRIGCRGLLTMAGLALAAPFLAGHCPGRSRRLPAPAAPLVEAPACLEVWVRLAGYRGCPILAAAGGYRLGLLCTAEGWSGGAVAFAGPFPGTAYVSNRPVPLGRWVHLAGLAAPAAPPAPPVRPALAPAAALPILIAIDGLDVTAVTAGLGPVPLGYDPWSVRASSRAPGPAVDRPCLANGAPCWQAGAWRFSRRSRSVAEVAVERGTPARLADLPPLRSPPPPAPAASRPALGGVAAMGGRRHTGGITRLGWKIVGTGLLVATAMAGAGLALRAAGQGR